MQKKLIVIAGPTAIGKTTVAIALAKHFNTQIVSVDSRQCYTQLNIGVARPTPQELAEAPHHLIASHSIHTPLDASQYATEALKAINNIFLTNHVAIIVGGTGLYIKAILYGLDNIPAINQAIALKVANATIKNGNLWLITQLNIYDPAYLHKYNEFHNQRYQKALSFFLTHQKSILSYQTNTQKQLPFNVFGYQLYMQRNQLYQQINNRVDAMLQNGLIAEVENLMQFKQHKILETIGYKEVILYKNGQLNYTNMVEKIKQHTRNYAKRQITWFNNQTNFTPIIPNTPAILQHFNTAQNK